MLAMLMVPAIALGAENWELDEKRHVVTISGEVTESDQLILSNTLFRKGQWCDNYRVENTSGVPLMVTAKVLSASGYNGANNGAVYNPSTMKMEWTLGENTIINPAEGTEISYTIPAGQSCNFALIADQSFIDDNYPDNQ